MSRAKPTTPSTTSQVALTNSDASGGLSWSVPRCFPRVDLKTPSFCANVKVAANACLGLFTVQKSFESWLAKCRANPLAMRSICRDASWRYWWHQTVTLLELLAVRPRAAGQGRAGHRRCGHAWSLRITKLKAPSSSLKCPHCGSLLKACQAPTPPAS